MITKWKRQLLDELPSIFSNGNSVRKKEREYCTLTLFCRLPSLSKGLFADWAKLYGPVLVFKALWQKTGLKRIISEYAKV